MFTIKAKEMFNAVQKKATHDNFWWRNDSEATEGVTSETINLEIGVTGIEMSEATEKQVQYYTIMNGQMDLFGTEFPFTIRLKYDAKREQVYPSVEVTKPEDEEKARFAPRLGKKHVAQILRVFEHACEIKGNELYQEYASELRKFYKVGENKGNKGKKISKDVEEETNFSDIEL